jgi:hypothetical protein
MIRRNEEAAPGIIPAPLFCASQPSEIAALHGAKHFLRLNEINLKH